MVGGIRTHANPLFGSRIREVISLGIGILDDIKSHLRSSTRILKAGGDTEVQAEATHAVTRGATCPIIKADDPGHCVPLALTESKSDDTGSNI